MKRKFVTLAAYAVCVLCAMTGNLKNAWGSYLYEPVVEVNGDGTTTGSAGVTSSIYVYQDSTASQASPVSSVSYSNTGASPRLVDSYSATSDGSLANNPAVSDAAALGHSYNGTAYVYNAGYDAVDTTAGVVASGTIPRVVGQTTVTSTLASNAIVLQTQTAATAYTGNNIRAAVGLTDAANPTLYTAGTVASGSGATGGWRNFSNTPSTALSSGTVTNTRTVESLGGQLFGSSSSGTLVGITLLDPAGASQAVPYITTGTSGNHSPYEFALFNDSKNSSLIDGYNTAYIADDGSAGAAAGGIEKWTYNGTAWSQAYILRDTSTTYYRGLAGQLDPTSGNYVLYATNSTGTLLQQVVDKGASSTFTTLATAPKNYVFRGVALAPTAVPEPGTFALLAAGAIGLLVCVRRRRAS